MAAVAVATGQEIGTTAVFYDAATLVNPTSVELIVVKPDLTEETYVAADMVHPATGVYIWYQVLAPRGVWAFRWSSVNPNTAYEVLAEATWGNTE